MILQELKAFPADSGDLDDMVFYAGVAELMLATCKDCNLEPPEWLVDKTSTLRREIAVRQRDSLERELKRTELALEGLKSSEEKRNDLRAKAERLKTQLSK